MIWKFKMPGFCQEVHGNFDNDAFARSSVYENKNILNTLQAFEMGRSGGVGLDLYWRHLKFINFWRIWKYCMKIIIKPLNPSYEMIPKKVGEGFQVV